MANITYDPITGQLFIDGIALSYVLNSQAGFPTSLVANARVLTRDHTTGQIFIDGAALSYGISVLGSQLPSTLFANGVSVGIAPTGTVAANGLLTLGTALDQIYSDGIWLYYPAGAAYAGSAAGFFWTVMSSTTAGTIYNNIYVPGTNNPSIPASNPISAAGPGAYTGVITEVTALQQTIPGGSMGPNGSVTCRYLVRNLGNANNKIIRQKFAGNSLGLNSTLTTNSGIGFIYTIYNRGRVDRQIGNSLNGDASSTTGSSTIASVNTAVNVTIGCSLQLSVATDFVILSASRIVIYPFL